MPLAFDSLSHGIIAFGFFNIESDMLILDRYFIFSTEFCRHINDIVQNASKNSYTTVWSVDYIAAAEDVGDLMGAIHGVRFTGFIGKLYRRYPFPQAPENFKQNPQGYQTQAVVSDIIREFAKRKDIPIEISSEKEEIAIGEYRFSRVQFQDLIKYIWRGGYPRWKDDTAPVYVDEMKSIVLQNSKGLFRDIDFENL
jgi:hypothetical protein